MLFGLLRWMLRVKPGIYAWHEANKVSLVLAGFSMLWLPVEFVAFVLGHIGHHCWFQCTLCHLNLGRRRMPPVWDIVYSRYLAGSTALLSNGHLRSFHGGTFHGVVLHHDHAA